MTDIQELVVPKSIPKTLAIVYSRPSAFSNGRSR